MARAPKGTTTIGFTNPRLQTVIRATRLPGTDHGQKIYVLRCGSCGAEYGANGSDIHARRCPSCDGGRPGLETDSEKIWAAKISNGPTTAFRQPCLYGSSRGTGPAECGSMARVPRCGSTP